MKGCVDVGTETCGAVVGMGFLVNLISCCLCLWKGLYPTALLFTIYTVISVFGYFKWAKLTKES